MRLFVALDVPEIVREAIGAIAAKLRPTCSDARWVRIEGIHVTLKFIGEVSPELSGQIETALATAPFPRPIPIKFRGLSYFPNDRRPRVLWAGVEAGPELPALASAVEKALEPLGIAQEARTFSPHLTLARFDPRRRTGSLEALQAAIAKVGPLDFGDAIVREFHLYLSILKQGGAEYTRVATFCSKESDPK
jgi:2'-5' RNA ligase